MRFTVQYPMGPAVEPGLLEPSTIGAFAQTAEAAGFNAIAFTEHPAPSAKWLGSGGHQSFDPLTALAFVAGQTSCIRLMTYLLVLPYRNPFLAAKQAATLDVLSNGRVVLAVGGGYLRSEFAALGVDFEERNELFDESIDVLTKIWQTPELAYEGRHFTAPGQTQVPPPVQRPHPPIWIGGNSRRARRRAATVGQGWTPLIVDEQLATTTRMPPLASPAALAAAVRELRELLDEAGRERADVTVQVEWAAANGMEGEPERLLDAVGQLADAGTDQIVVVPPEGDVARVFEALEAYGAQVITRSSSAA